MNEGKFKVFANCVAANVDTIAARAVAFLYFRTKFSGGKATLQELLSDFESAGLGRPQPSNLRQTLTNDRRTKRVAVDTWIIPANRLVDVEVRLSSCLQYVRDKKFSPNVAKNKKTYNNNFVNSQRIKDLKGVASKKYDLSRLIKMCQEINGNFLQKNYISVIIIVRTIMNHVAPIFGLHSFSEIAHNYKCEKSLKSSLLNLENSSRTIADGYLHIPARNKESLPTSTQVNFSQDMDLLLGEVVRLLK
ncbi:MAG: hypothetical protein V1649_04210 [Patescibacteria group bacterium]